MKLKLFSLIVLSMMLCFVSCIKHSFTCPAQETIAIILRLDMPGSKATRASIETPITTTAAIVHRMDVYFYDKTSAIVYSVKSLTQEQLTQSGSSDGLIIPDLHSNVDAVTIIANNTDAKNLSVDIGGSISILLDKDLDISLEQDFDNITYFGLTDNLVQVSTPEAGDDDIDYFNASLTVKPVVARVELSDIVCPDFGTIWSDLHLNSAFVENVYTTVELNSIDDLSNINSAPFYATESDVVASNQTWWLEVLEGVNATNTINRTPWSPMVNTPVEAGVFVFNIFQVADFPPTIGLYLNATINPSTRISVNRFVKFNTYKDDDENYDSFEAGHIYKVKPMFTEVDLTTFDINPSSIILEITVQDWSIHNNIIAAQ